MKILFLFISFSLLFGCGSNWVHPEGHDLGTDKEACQKVAIEQVKKQYGYTTCKEYAYEKGMERYGWSEGLTSTQRVPNSKDMKKALIECKFFYNAALESCMKEKGWEENK